MGREEARTAGGRALDAMMRRQPEEAAGHLADVGGEDLLTVILGLCDTYIGRIHGPEAYGKPLRMAWWAVETGSLEYDPDKVPPRPRWAGQVIAARAADDEAAFMALMRQPAEGADLGDHVTALLDMVAQSLNNLPHHDAPKAVD